MQTAEPAGSPAPRIEVNHRVDSATILIVDDEATVRRTARRALEHSGYEVLEAENGIKALELFHLERSRIGLVVLDVVMPGMSGWEVLTELKAEAPSVPVVLVSGYAWTGQRPWDSTPTADAFLRKPFELAELTATVRSLMEQRAADNG